MKTAVAYYSLGGTTRSYARAAAKARNADLIELTPKSPYNRFTAFVRGCPEAVKQKAVALDGMPLFVGYDRVVLMAPVWAGYPAPVFNSAVELVPPGTEVEVILVSGSGSSDLDNSLMLLACIEISPVWVRNTKPSIPIISPISHFLKSA